MDKPWYLWRGAAVRHKGSDDIGKVVDITEEHVLILMCEGSDRYVRTERPQDHYTLESNLAVLLAPKGATHVRITKQGVIYYEDEIGTMSSEHITWPNCPDHLKGHTWELPR